MNSIEKILYQCSICNTFFHTKESAELCCKDDYVCEVCGKPVKQFYKICEECVEKKQYNLANKVTEKEYTERFVFKAGYGPEYFESINNFVEYCENNCIDIPKYVYACKAIPWRGLDIENHLIETLEDHCEDAIDDLIDLNDLLEFCAEWEEKQIIQSFCYDYTTVILIEERKD